MIGKAKIFLYALFTPNKHIPPHKFPVKWYHKCLLILVRQSKTFKDCPKELKYSDWVQVKKRGLKYWNVTKLYLFGISGLWLALYLRKLEDKKIQKGVEERKNQNLSPIPPYTFGLKEDPFYHSYNTMMPDNYKYP